jgi:SAM-dependent methyltransferase
VSEASYDELGKGYAVQRRADPRIAAMVRSALGNARSVVNVGAGAGSYEPTDLEVLAIEPSDTMVRQRSASAAPCVRGAAEALPLDSGSHDAAMAVLTIHHWSDWRSGLREMRRVARRRIVLLTFDAETSDFWLTRDYLPALNELDRRTMPSLGALAGELGEFHATPLLVPHDCTDGFLGAFWRRPHIYLNPLARSSISAFSRIDADEGLGRLANDLERGAWHERNADLLDREALDVGYRLLRWEIDTRA